MTFPDPFAAPLAANDSGDPIENSRDQWGRARVLNPRTGQVEAFTRATTLAHTLPDSYNLNQWDRRCVARGLGLNASLVALAATLDPDDPADRKRYEAEILEPAKELAGGNDGKRKGTALHAATEMLDRGTDPKRIPEMFHADLRAYTAAIAMVGVSTVPELTEVFTIAPDVRSAGRLDRGLRINGQIVIGDVKSQKHDPRQWSLLAIATQLAVYAHGLAEFGWTRDGRTYTPVAEQVNLKTAVIIWLPVGKAHCELIPVDIEKGWILAQMAHRVRQERSAAKSLAAAWGDAFPKLEIKTGLDLGANIALTVTRAPEPAPELTSVFAQPSTVQEKLDVAFAEAPAVLAAVGAAVSTAPDYAGKQCPDGRKHEPHDGCPGRKKRSPAQIKLDEQAAHAALREMGDPVSGPGIAAAQAAGEAARGQASAVADAAEELTPERMAELEQQDAALAELHALNQSPNSAASQAGLIDGDGKSFRQELTGDEPIGTTVTVDGIEFTKHSDNPFGDQPAQQSVDPVIVLRGKVRRAQTAEELAKLWQENAAEWTDELTALGQNVLKLRAQGITT